jgi:hypothetical protein
MENKIVAYIEPIYHQNNDNYNIYFTSSHGNEGVLHNDFKSVYISGVNKSDKKENKILDNIPYVIQIGGSIVYEGVYKLNENIFPATDIPFKDLKYHQIVIYFRTYLPLNELNILFRVEVELFENTHKNNEMIEIDWPLKNGTIKNKLRILQGMCGLGYHYDPNYCDKYENIKYEMIKYNNLSFCKTEQQITCSVPVFYNMSYDFFPLENNYDKVCLHILLKNEGVVNFSVQQINFHFTAKTNEFILYPPLGIDTICNLSVTCLDNQEEPNLEMNKSVFKKNDFRENTYFYGKQDFSEHIALIGCHQSNSKNNSYLFFKLTNLKPKTQYIFTYHNCYFERELRNKIAKTSKFGEKINISK